MSEEIVYEHKIIESEQGFDNVNPINTPPIAGEPSHGAYNQTAINTQGDTNTTDIAQQANFISLTKSTISESLPAMIGYVQPMTSSVGYIFGLSQKDRTKINPSTGGIYPRSNTAEDDITILRKLVQTEIREVKLDVTNETAEDINNLFGTNFKTSYAKFIQSGGEIWDGPNGPLAKFFLSIARRRMTDKINKDFTDWIDTVATRKGQLTISAWDENAKLIGVIAELREALFKNSGVSAPHWLLTTPKIASLLATQLSFNVNNSPSVTGYSTAAAEINSKRGYIATVGNIDIYQYDFLHDTSDPIVTGGTVSDSEDTGVIYMGFKGGPDTSSVYYMPYNEYIVQGGEDYSTGQSNVYYRVRDAWSTNPLDTYDINSVTSPVIELDQAGNPITPDTRTDKKSQFIVKAEITFATKLLQP